MKKGNNEMKVQVMLNDDMVSKLDNYAKQIGVSRSALCAVIIGQYVMSSDKIFQQTQDAINNTIKSE